MGTVTDGIVHELLKECDVERWRSSYEPCEKCMTTEQ